MKISTKGRYALRMMLDLAEYRGNGFVALKDISERQGVSKKYLEPIVTLLKWSDILQANRGAQGGYRQRSRFHGNDFDFRILRFQKRTGSRNGATSSDS